MPDERGLIKFEQYAPDIHSVAVSSVSTTATNVVPRVDGYGPFPSLVPISKPLPATCRGVFFARDPDGSVSLFAGTQETGGSRLYKLDKTTLEWENVTQVTGTAPPKIHPTDPAPPAGPSFGGLYPPLPPFDNWQFAQHGVFVIAVQVNVPPQYFQLGSTSGTNFASIADRGSLNPDTTNPQPVPSASHVAIVNRFVVLSGIDGFPFRIQWSDINDIFTWDVGAGLADLQDLPDGGFVHDIRGGDQYGIVFQDNSIRSLIFAPGSPEVFDIFRISTQDGIYGQYSSITAGDRVYFYSPQGFKVIISGGYPKPIGKQRVDNTFIADVDQNNLQLFQAATDPMSTRVFWQYKSRSGGAGFADKILVYDWAIGEEGQWSLISQQQIETLSYMAKPGLTLDGLDSAAVPQINVTAAEQGTGTTIRLTVDALPPGNTVTIWGIAVGASRCVEANSANRAAPNTGAAWFFTIASAVAPFKIDLTGSTFVAGHTSTGGTLAGTFGKFGGSIDTDYSPGIFGIATGPGALPPFDSFSQDATLRLAAFDNLHQLGFFSGPFLEAVIDTPTSDLGARFAMLFMRPITDTTRIDGAAACFGSIGKMDNAQQGPVYSTEQPMNALGLVPLRVETRYAVGRIRIPAETSWTYATGVRVPDAVAEQGDR